jgi:membrane protein implicated in regulation of membrane protease activity
MSVAGLAFYYIGPILIAFFVGAYTSVVDRVGWKMTVTLTAGVSFLLVCLWAWRSDKKNNAAIKAGSVEAFNERVKDLQAGPLKYTHEQAVAAANRIRNGED